MSGMELVIRLPLGPMQPRRLLDVIPRIPPQEVGGNPLRWLEGVTWEPWPCRALVADDEASCDRESGFTVVPHACEAALTQTPFRISDAMKASTLDLDFPTVEAYLGARYSMQISATFASELLSGTASGGMSLSSEATAPNGAAFGVAATPVWNAMSILEEEIAERLQGQVGFIHVPPGMLVQAVSECALTLDPTGWWRTPAGNVVISDAGYMNPPPPTNEAVSSTGEDWLYASGPVWYEATAPMLVGQGSQTMLMTRNTFEQYIAGYGILVFDPCPVTAVLASYNIEDETP